MPDAPAAADHDHPPAPPRRRTARRVLLADPAAPAELIERLWHDPDGLVEDPSLATTIKAGDRTTIARIDSSPRRATEDHREDEGGKQGPKREQLDDTSSHLRGRLSVTSSLSDLRGPPWPSVVNLVVLKRYNAKGPLHTATHLPLRSRARWCWVNAQRVMDLGLRTPRPLILVEDRLGPLRLRSFIVTEFIDGRPLLELVEAGALNGERLARVADRFAHVWRTLGEQRLHYGDMKASNFMIDAQDRLWLIDLDGMRRVPPGPFWRNRRRDDYARFMRNWARQPDVAAAFRARLGTA